ncbi:MAG: hypothetical protein COU81_03880, partial [Candidatus Portnoybacteria bacterium CG10_big_fil_rev_8_21_14_0_10_36_7]
RKKIIEVLPDVDCVGLSVMTSQIASALELSKIIKDFNQNIKIIWGGFHPTFFSKQVTSHNLVDVAVLHEGEATMLELVKEFRGENKEADLNKIKGIAFVDKNGKFIATNRRGFVKFDDLPLPNWDIMPEEILYNLEIVPTYTSRGCPHRCTFCVNAITQNLWRWRVPEKVLKDLEIISKKPYFKDKPVRFWDENFFVNILRAKQIIKGIIDRNINIKWETTIRANYLNKRMVDDSMMTQMKKSGCYLLSFGAESGSDRILKKLEKGISRQEIIDSSIQCIRHNIIPQYSFMVGLPGEVRKDINQTISLIDVLVRLSPKIQILGPQAFRPYPGSKLYEDCLASGWQEPKSLEEWAKVMQDQLNYLSPRQFPWLKNPSLVESLEAYARFGAMPIKSALGSTIKANKMIKLGFILLCKLRWKFKFFVWPFEYYLAQKYVTKFKE